MRSYDRIVATVQDKQMTMASATDRPGERGSGSAGRGSGHGASDQVIVSKQNGARLTKHEVNEGNRSAIVARRVDGK